MKTIQHQRGSSHLMLILAVAVIAAIGVVGYRVTQTDTSSVESTSVAPAKNTSAPTAIKTSADLKKAEASLDSATIDSSLNPNQLDNDISALL